MAQQTRIRTVTRRVLLIGSLMLIIALPADSVRAAASMPYNHAVQDTARIIDLSVQNVFNRLYSTGMQYYELQEYGNAIPSLRRCSEIDSTNFDILYLLGTCYYQIEELDQAIAVFAMIVRQDPEEETALYNLASIYWEQGEEELHTVIYEQLLELSPENPEYLEHLLALYQRAGNREGYMRLLQVQADENPDDPEIQRQLAALHREGGDQAAQIEALENAIRLDPTNLGNLEQLARIYAIDLNQPDDAARLYGMIVDVQPENPIAWQIWGRYLTRTGKPDSAVVALQRSLELDPGQAGAYSELALVLSDQQRYDEAASWIEKALEQQPEDAYAHVAWGDILQAKAFATADEDGIIPYNAKIILEEAIEKYQKALELGGVSAEILQYAASEAEKLEPYKRTQAEIFMERARRQIPPRI
ncbi:tetratricopeptide repeat protein [Gemmatimonadota bacterium]